MISFAEFESTFLAALQKERSYLQGLQGKLEAQLSAWIEHIFRDYLGYSWEEILHPEGTTVGSKGSKPLFPDLQINILDNGLIYVECKRMGRLDGPKGPEELEDGVGQLRSYIHAYLYRADVKPKTVLGVVTDGNRWRLIGLNKTNEFDTIADWTFLTDDPRLIAQRLWLLAKPALAQPTPALVEFLARRTMADVLDRKTKWLTKQVNKKLPGGSISEELIGRWLRDAFSDSAAPRQLAPGGSSARPGLGPEQPPPVTGAGSGPPDKFVGGEDEARAIIEANKPGGATSPLAGQDVTLAALIAAGVLTPPLRLFRKYKGRTVEATLLADGTVEFEGRQYDTSSAAAEAARATVAGRRMTTNGWTFWQYQGAGGKRLTLSDARHQVGRPAGGGASGERGLRHQAERDALRKRFWQGLLSRPKAKNTRHANIKPGGYSGIAAGSGVKGLPFVYVIGQDEGRVELWIDRGAGKATENKDIFDRIRAAKDEIETAFGGELDWQRLDDKQGCRIAYATTAGGYRSDEAKWPQIQDAMIDAMSRLEKALTPHLTNLKTELAAEGA
jgi:hypothetical protein